MNEYAAAGSKVSVVVPTYKERVNITPLVERIHGAMSAYDYEVVFVDDNSRDRSVETVRSLAKGGYPVRMIVREKERGLATAVVAGMKQATGDVIVVLDADLQHPPEVIPSLVRAVAGGAGIAVASRYVAGGGCRGWSLTRRIMSKGAIKIAHALLPSTRNVSDPVSGFFALSRHIVNPDRLRPTGYKILLEILVEAAQGTWVTEVPYVFEVRSRGESKLDIRQQVEYLRHIFDLMKREGELARLLKFALVGASGIVVNLGLLWLLHRVGLKSGLLGLMSSAIGTEISILTNFTLNDLFTFADRRRGNGSRRITRLVKFNAVSLIALGVTVGIYGLLTHLAGLNYLLAQFAGILVAFVINYVANTSWTWKTVDQKS